MKNHLDIIHMTENIPSASENYQVICFDKLLDRIFPNLNAFISSDVVKEIRSILTLKYGNDNICIKQNGILESVKIQELKYYQPTVGINGPQHTEIDQPVYVIIHDGKKILLNSYHRTLVNLVNNNLNIKAYVLST
jgi:hypothetical protein